MLQKIKEYLLFHPNSNFFTAVIFSITTMNTEEWVALITALGMVFSSIVGVLMQLSRWKQERSERLSKMEIEKQTKGFEFERMKIENDSLNLALREKIRRFESNEIRSENENEEPS
jgi:hypothetical protein